MSRPGTVLVCGASVAGPALAYWLCRYGYEVTVVEQTPQLRRGLGGHAVDLFGPAVEVTEWMGVLPQVLAARTRTDLLAFERPGKPPIEVDFAELAAGISDRHVEIMRGELAAILHEATQDRARYLFGDSITAIDDHDEDIEVTFEHAPPERFDLVIGADGLHSNVRRLAFGDESAFRHYLGGYFSVFTLPTYSGPTDRMRIYTTPGKMAALHTVWQTGQARAGFFFRRATEFAYDHRDATQQRELLRHVFDGEGWEIPRLLEQMDHSPDFYLDSISQIRMRQLSKGRVCLVGDAGYSPGPAVGGGTTVALVGAYVLAGELAAARDDHAAGYAGYQREMNEFIRHSRAIGPASMRTLIPNTARQVWLAANMMRVLPRLPAAVQRRLGELQGGPARALNSITLKRYPTVR
ncbi:FAD-dependent monooxygenase [Pseudonocardia eucalypti]|uniref:FAD-dependent monooxygenase n=1 Tax=Pseudonocardia eucalypti TaxID=648755 RepID=A0ABP9QHS2_9PSEU|nr:2-polyprenyl-6-methoxyphenol hydroxylase-like FAD-dependent oxidoreductase [Pseudonocardia eucalypti]